MEEIGGSVTQWKKYKNIGCGIVTKQNINLQNVEEHRLKKCLKNINWRMLLS